MHHRVYSVVALLAALGLLVACAAPQGGAATGSSSAPAAKANTITAVKVDTVALDPAAAYWADAPALTVPTVASVEGQPNGPDVKIQAAYDATSFTMRLEWADTSEDIRHRVWVWNGSEFTRSSRQQDRMAVLFPMGNNAEFASKGCAAACHNSDADPKKWWMGAEDPAVFYDVWQWTSASTNPVGQAQDMIMNVQTDPTEIESARHGDALESGGSVSNSSSEPPGPKMMNADINATFIMTGQQVEIDTSKLISGTMIPGSILAPWVGSRGDIQAKGQWQDGKWVVVLIRALDTGHDDDLVLTPPKPYPLGVAVFDHLDHLDHTSTPDVITLEWQ